MDPEEEIQTSPRPVPPSKNMDFARCIKLLLDHHRLRRQEWPDDGTYIVMKNEKLMIFTPVDKALHPLTVSAADLEGTDWIVVH